MACQFEIPYTDHFEYRNNEFERHFWGRVPLVYGAALFAYHPNGRTQHVIHQLKYSGKSQIGISLGRLLGHKILKHFDPLPHMIIPVPLTSKRKAKRGYNQSALIAQGIREIIAKPFDSSILIKTHETESQTGKNRSKRIENMEAAFRLKNGKAIRHKHVLLVDDVLTTGATLEACALQFKGHTDLISYVTIAYGK